MTQATYGWISEQAATVGVGLEIEVDGEVLAGLPLNVRDAPGQLGTVITGVWGEQFLWAWSSAPPSDPCNSSWLEISVPPQRGDGATTGWVCGEYILVRSADLVVSSLTGSSAGIVGGQISINTTLANQNLASAGAFRLGFYFSTDPIITTADTFSGWSCNFAGGLAGNSSTACAGPIGVPASLPAGIYYLGAIVDDLGQVPESNEANNSRPGDSGLISLRNPILTVERAGSGTGIINVSPLGFTCGGTCQIGVLPGTAVTLSFSSDPGTTLDGWSPITCSSSTVVNTDMKCIAFCSHCPASGSGTTIESMAPCNTDSTLTVATAGTGTGTVTTSPTGINCPGACSQSFPNGTQVTLIAAPTGSSSFSGWSASADSDCFDGVVDLQADRACTAAFSYTGAQPNDLIWATKNPLPATRESAVGVGVGNLFHVIGGNSPLSHLTYDTTTNQWTQKPDLPSPGVYDGSGVVVNGKIYISGNYIFPTLFKIYDTSAQSWADGPSPPTPRFGAGMAAVNGKIYLIGGSSSGGYVGTVEMFDTASGTWSATLRAPMPTPRGYAAVAAVNGLIYAIGGFNDASQRLPWTEVYDPVADSWTPGPQMPTGRAATAVGVIAGHLYVVGGETGSGITNAVEEFEPAAGIWTVRTTAPTARSYAAAAVVTNHLYVAGGRGPSGNLSVVEEGTPIAGCTDAATCTDGNLCTIDSCDGSTGICGHAAIPCPPPDQCHTSGWCDPSIGTCVNFLPVPNGTICSDGNACTALDTCQGGACQAGPLVDADLDGHLHLACGGDDCNDNDSLVWSPPAEVMNLVVSDSSPTTISWDSQSVLRGPGTSYDLVSGTIGPATGIVWSGVTSLQNSSSTVSFAESRPDPPVGTGYWYLARARSSCGIGTFGTSVRDFGIFPQVITFTSTRDGNPEIYIMNPDGSGQQRLTNDPSTDDQGVLSPDRTKIAFHSRRTGNSDIFIMNIDGTNPVQLTTDMGEDEGPAWSPDGQMIYFNSYRFGGSDIFVINTDGTGEMRLTTNGGNNHSLAVSPDGTKLAFHSSRDGNDEIYIMNSDGAGQTRLTSNPWEDTNPAFSPDGQKIAFYSNRDGNGEIYVMNMDGTGQTRLTTNPSRDDLPVYSSDGQKITFVTDRDGNYEIYVMNSDGTNPIRLTTDPETDTFPDWR